MPGLNHKVLAATATAALLCLPVRPAAAGPIFFAPWALGHALCAGARLATLPLVLASQAVSAVLQAPYQPSGGYYGGAAGYYPPPNYYPRAPAYFAPPQGYYPAPQSYYRPPLPYAPAVRQSYGRPPAYYAARMPYSYGGPGNGRPGGVAYRRW